jgi:5-carboxymethyl-2-hydroxymuconate isomerase/acylpyruvate hydrolase
VRLLTFTSGKAGAARIGVRRADRVLDLSLAAPLAGVTLPGNMRHLLEQGEAGLEAVRRLDQRAHADPQRFAAAFVAESAIRYLPPVPNLDKFLCVGKNYRAHLEELRKNDLIKEMPEEVTGFVKIHACLTGHREDVVKPAAVANLDYEPELVFVIGKRALGVKKTDDWRPYVAGVTVLNDLTDRDMQKREVASGSRFWTAKNAPGFGPLGPEIVTLDEVPDPYDVWMTCAVNGEPRMRVNTREQIWRMNDILAHFSRTIPLEPGDMFATGAPGGVAAGKPNAKDLYLKPGDVVECAIEGITTLSTRIVSPEDRP